MREPSRILQVSGPKGSGKTSALFAMQRELEQRSVDAEYVYIQQDGELPGFKRDPDRTLLLDEAQRLPVRSMRKLLLNSASPSGHGANPRLVFSTHSDWSILMQKHSVDFTSLDLSTPTARDLASILAQRVDHFALPQGTRVHFEDEAVQLLLTTFGADLRAMESLLYAYFQSIPDRGEITASALKEQLAT
jgi:chromosomal replication initiation ATPase DnaA